MFCTNCGSNNFETDTARGTICCGECGMMQEENLIVNTIQFDSAGNKPEMHGQIVNLDNKNIGTQFVDSSFLIKNTIKNICLKLSLGQEHVECAFRWYKICLGHSLTKGKSILYTLSACVYISSRQESTPHLLIDFSNKLRIDMFKIGKVFLKLRNVLGVEIPLTDPSLYMHRFISQLKFKNSEILNFSLRLIQRMKKDWIVCGRRPNNSCGAALLIASRVYEEPRNIEEIAKVVQASVLTIKKRLKEISETESAGLDILNFNKLWLESEDEPPIMKVTPKMEVKRDSFIKNSINSNNVFSKKEIEFSKILSTPEEMKGNNSIKDNIKMNYNNSIKDNIKMNYNNSIKDNRFIEDNSFTTEDFVLNDFILNETEVENKSIMWEKMYGEYVKEMEMKRSKKSKTTVLRTRKKKHNFGSIEEAFQSLDKKVTSKLNYAAIDGLFDS